MFKFYCCNLPEELAAVCVMEWPSKNSQAFLEEDGLTGTNGHLQPYPGMVFGLVPGDSCSWKQTSQGIGLGCSRALFLDLTGVVSSLFAGHRGMLGL